MTIPNHGETPQEVFIHFSMLEDEPAGMCWEGDRYPDATQRVTSNISEVTCAECKKHIKTLHDLNRAVAPVETPDDELCQNCHRENPVWFAPNAVWNAVVTEISGILCPICFINRAERQGFRCTGWELVPELVNRPTDDKTPVGGGAPANLASVETRLTAEQFWREYYKDDPNFPPSQAACTFAEAFRDKSEAELRAKLAEQEKERDLYALLRGICEEVIDWLGTLSYDGIDDAKSVLDHPLSKDIRLKLQQMYDHPLDNKLLIRTDVLEAKLERADAAEAEAAALRERERWIRVEEKLPEANGEYQIAEKYLEVSTADFFADDKTWKTVRCYGVDAEERELYNVTHWKALSAAPEP